MASCSDLPKEDHLEKFYHIFGCSKKHHNAWMVFDPSAPDVGISDFERQDWTTSTFGNLLETNEEPERPVNLTDARGIRFIFRGKVDAYHAADAVTRRSKTGFIVYFNSSPTHWFSKKK